MAELMGKYSNLIFLEDGMIVDALRHIGAGASRVRRVLPTLPYEWPPAQDKHNVLTSSLDDILRHIFSLKEKTLAVAIRDICLGFGPVTAKEIARAAGFSAEAPISSLEEADLAVLKASFANTLSAAADPAANACLVLDENGKVQSGIYLRPF